MIRRSHAGFHAGSRATLPVIAVVAVFAVLSVPPARAHCDTLDGPVVADARAALAKGDVTPVLKWVGPKDEAEIRAAFRRAAAVRAGGAEARELADRYFFETLVRVHRASEGAPYTGLKPAGQPVEAGIRAADEALAKGSGEALVREATEVVAAGIHKRYSHAAEARKHAEHNVAAGREYVAAYVDLMHYVEGIHQAAVGPAHHGAPQEAHSTPQDANGEEAHGDAHGKKQGGDGQ